MDNILDVKGDVNTLAGSVCNVETSVIEQVYIREAF
jgi:hypothetical protein